MSYDRNGKFILRGVWANRSESRRRRGGVHPPGEHQTQQGADEDEHLVEHGRVGPLDGTMEVILQAGEPAISVELMIDSS